MAEKTTVGRNSEIFWSKMERKDSSDESTDAFVPGVSLPGNRRPSRLRSRKTREIRATIPKKQPVIETLSDTTTSKNTSLSTTRDFSFAERSIRQLKKASLKDLRPEDKKRIADLIKELARVGEEREQAVNQLHGERENYEKQLLTLVQQQEKILQEREDIQNKLFNCQHLLTEYQAQILNKQDRINSSIADLKLAVGEVSEGSAPGCRLTLPNPVSEIQILSPRGRDHHKALDNQLEPNVNHGTDPGRSQDYYQATTRDRQTRHSLSTSVSDLDYIRPLVLNDLDDLDYYQDQNRQTSSANQEVVNRTSANQNEDNIDIATETRNPSEGLKRPYTSLIDKEIARERSLSRSSRGSLGSRSRSRSLSPNDGRPRFSYPQKLSGIGPLHEPVASSTHKSLEIRAQMSNNIDPDSPRSSIRGSSVRAQSPFESERQERGRVVFNERTETSEGAKLHSPNLKKGEIFKDPEYVNYYKQLTSSGRKKELLQQRQLLLDEQERLRLILKEQEDQLKRKQLEYEERQKLQKERMEFYEKGDMFPPLKLNFDADSEKGYSDGREEEPGIVLRRVGGETGGAGKRREIEKEGEMDSGRTTPQERIQIDEHLEIKSRVSASTSPRRPSQQERVSMATSPLHSPRSQGSTRSTDSEEDLGPKVIDVATSISYRTPLTDAGNRQGNLPLHGNRHRTSPGVKELAITSPPTSARIPGDKTLNVLDIVNSIEELPAQTHASYIEDQENNLEPITITPHKLRSSLGSKSDNQSSPYRLRHSPAINRQSPAINRQSPANYRTKQRMMGKEDEESLEENRILEDIFFL